MQTIDPEHRAAVGSGIGNEVLADRVQVRLEVLDEVQRGLLDMPLVPFFVLCEPLPVVICLLLDQEVEHLVVEVGLHFHASRSARIRRACPQGRASTNPAAVKSPSNARASVIRSRRMISKLTAST